MWRILLGKPIVRKLVPDSPKARFYASWRDGYTEDAALSQVAASYGLDPDFAHKWTLREIEHVLFLRHLRQTGKLES